MNIIVIFTCYNRKNKTETCIQTLALGNPMCRFTFVVVDDNSSDGTAELLEKMKEKYEIHILHGDGKLFYSGGMHLGMEYVLEQCGQTYDYVLMVNDDVIFFDNVIEKLSFQSREQNNAIVVGAMCDDNGQLSYSAVKYIRGVKCRNMSVSEWEIPADTFCANCVLIPYQSFKETGSMDGAYIHAMGDFDYGLMLKNKGFDIHVSKTFAGTCNDNPIVNTWMDSSLGRWERIKKKENPKGLPAGQWFYFLRKNFGFVTAVIRSCTPYIKILLGK